MNNNVYGYGNPYNPDVLKDLDEIKKEIEDEMKKEEPDREKLLELKEKQLYRGMALTTGTLYGRIYNGLYPW